MAELAGVMVGNYFLLERLDSEGMVETYRARPTTQGGFDVILRLFRPQFPDPTGFQEHFAAEVEKVWRCHHEHIQPLLEFGAGEGLLYCVTRLIEADARAISAAYGGTGSVHVRRCGSDGSVVRCPALCPRTRYRAWESTALKHSITRWRTPVAYQFQHEAHLPGG